MTSHAVHHYPERAGLSRWIVVGFLSGAASVLVFHQGGAALLYALELSARAPYSMQPTSPFGPLKGQSMAGGLVPMAMTAIGLALFGRPRARPPR